MKKGFESWMIMSRKLYEKYKCKIFNLIQEMKKRISFRLFFTVVWRGICQVFRFIGKLFGYTDNCTYSKVLWRISATCMTVLLCLFTVCFVSAFIIEVVIPKWINPYFSENGWESEYISNHVAFQKNCSCRDSRIYDLTKKKVLLDDVDWVVVSEDYDSLAVFSKDGKRGYLNRFTGGISIKPIYSRAWMFSEGLAAVEKDGKLIFIDHTGQTVIDKGFEADNSNIAYTFKDGYCLMKDNVDGNIGLIDKNGNWALKPEFIGINRMDGLLIIEKPNGQKAVFDNDMRMVLPFADAEYFIVDNSIFATLSNHTMRKYDMSGNIIEPFFIKNIEQMFYNTDKLQSAVYSGAGDSESVDSENAPYCVQAVAKCKRYEADDYYYGLINNEGQIITLPLYSEITAVDEDMYLCKDEQGHGILLNGEGVRVN